MNQNYRHIVISQQNFERLKNYGKVGDSFNDAITKILKRMEDDERE